MSIHLDALLDSTDTVLYTISDHVTWSQHVFCVPLWSINVPLWQDGV